MHVFGEAGDEAEEIEVVGDGYIQYLDGVVEKAEVAGEASVGPAFAAAPRKFDLVDNLLWKGSRLVLEVEVDATPVRFGGDQLGDVSHILIDGDSAGRSARGDLSDVGDDGFLGRCNEGDVVDVRVEVRGFLVEGEEMIRASYCRENGVAVTGGGDFETDEAVSVNGWHVEAVKRAYFFTKFELMIVRLEIDARDELTFVDHLKAIGDTTEPNLRSGGNAVVDVNRVVNETMALFQNFRDGEASNPTTNGGGIGHVLDDVGVEELLRVRGEDSTGNNTVTSGASWKVAMEFCWVMQVGAGDLQIGESLLRSRQSLESVEVDALEPFGEVQGKRGRGSLIEVGKTLGRGDGGAVDDCREARHGDARKVKRVTMVDYARVTRSAARLRAAF